jgi:hypothetical protein
MTEQIQYIAGYIRNACLKHALLVKYTIHLRIRGMRSPAQASGIEGWKASQRAKARKSRALSALLATAR